LQAAADELQAMDRAVAAGDYLAWTQHNRAFHWLCRKDCGLPQLLRILEDTQDQIHRFRLFRGAATARAAQSEAEHAAIFAAMRDRNGEKVEQLVREHYLEGDRAFEAYLRSISEEPV
jgi:DNA-binding GntR family transcriptional regulator